MQMTDNTYYDESYTVFQIDGNGTTELYTFSLPDSGQVYTLWDDPLPRPGVVTYRIQLNLPWYVETDPNSYYYDFQFEAQLQTPVLENPEEWEYVCGSQNKLLYSSSGDQSFHDTEIYRSLNVDGPYTLIATVPSTQFRLCRRRCAAGELLLQSAPYLEWYVFRVFKYSILRRLFRLVCSWL